MFGDGKNLRDSNNSAGTSTGAILSVKDTFMPISYTKTEKLITALYMVTDIMDMDEPLRKKLRTAGLEVLSDIYKIQQNETGNTLSFMNSRVTEIMSFLNIASNLNIISEMNSNILKKEFSELLEAIKDSATKNTKAFHNRVDLSDFFAEEESAQENPPVPSLGRATPSFGAIEKKGIYPSIGQPKPVNSLGVQKGATLMKALEKIKVSDINSKLNHSHVSTYVFDALKKDRQAGILNMIKLVGGGATIKDIKDKVHTNPKQAGSLVSCGEKTLQRELIAMVKNGVLYKTGDKRWSKYFVKS